MTPLAKIYLKYNKNFMLPKCIGGKCSCFAVEEQTVLCSLEDPLSYVIQVQSIIKKYKRNYDNHFRLACLKLCDVGNVEGRVLLDIIRDHYNTLSIFQDYLLKTHEKCSSLEGVTYLEYLKVVQKKAIFIKRRMKELIILFKETGEKAVRPKMTFDLLIYSHLHTTEIFKKLIIQLFTKNS